MEPKNYIYVFNDDVMMESIQKLIECVLNEITSYFHVVMEYDEEKKDIKFAIMNDGPYV